MKNYNKFNEQDNNNAQVIEDNNEVMAEETQATNNKGSFWSIRNITIIATATVAVGTGIYIAVKKGLFKKKGKAAAQEEDEKTEN